MSEKTRVLHDEIAKMKTFWNSLERVRTDGNDEKQEKTLGRLLSAEMIAYRLPVTALQDASITTSG